MSDIKYALYTSSKGFKVVGGTAAQFLKADGSIDNVQYVPYNGANTNVNLNGKNLETSGRLTTGNEILNLASASVQGTGIIDIKLPNMNIMGVFYIDIFTYGILVGTFICQFYTYYNNSLNFAGNNSVAFLGKNSNGLTVRYVTVGTDFSSERHMYIGGLTTNWGNWTEINIRGLINVNRESLKSNPPAISLITAEASPLNTSFTFNDFSVESALKLGSSRSINGTPFNATADITTEIWGTSRNLTIGNSTKPFNGSGNIAWTLPEIGALPLSGGELTGALTIRPANSSSVFEQDVLILHDSGTAEGNIIPLAFKYGVSATPTAFIKAVGKGSSGSNGASFQFFDNATKHTEINSSGITANAFVKTGGTAAQFLKADGSIDSNPYLPVAAASNYPLRSLLGGDVNSIRVLDTRNTNPLPSTEIRAGVLYDFKTSSAIGLSGAGIGTYSAAITMVPYSDNSGNINTAFRLAQTANSMYFQNYISAGKWGTWNKLLTDNDLSNYHTKSESLSLFVGKTGIETINDPKTFTSSPVIPNGTLGNHAVNLNQLSGALNNYFNKFSIDYTGSNHDLNTLSQTGFYSIAYGAVNSGNYTGAKDGYRALLHFETENIYSATQIQAERYNGNIVSRTKADGGWSNWVRHWGNNDFTQSDIDNWNDTFNNQNNYVPIAGTNNLTGLISTPDAKVQIGRDQYYEGKLWVSDYNNSYFPGQSFQLLADIENGFSVAANDNGTMFSNLSLYPGGVYITSSNNGSSNAYNINNDGIFAQYKIPMFDGSFIQRKYLTDNYVSQSSFNSNDFVTTTGMQLISGAKEFVASIMASGGIISANAINDEVFVGDGSTARLRDEIVNDESEYAIRLDPHHYEIDSSGNLEVNDRNRLIHIIGEEIKMSVNFKEIYPKQQIVIYNFDQKDYPMTVLVQGKPVYSVKPGAFLRLYVTKSLRVIAESQLPCEFIW